MEKKVSALKDAAREELRLIEDMGGAVAAIDSAYMKEQLVRSNAERLEAIERGEQVVVGVNKYEASAASLLAADGEAVMSVDPAVEAQQIEALEAWRADRDAAAVQGALDGLRAAAKEGRNIMEPSITCAKAGVTTGEWADVLRSVFGEYRAPTGVSSAARNDATGLEDLRAGVDAVSRKLGKRLSFLVGKPGLDGHSNGAEQIAVRARDAGMEIVYEGIRLTPEQIVTRAREGAVHVVGLSILSGSHIALVKDVMARLRAENLSHIPVIVGGIIPQDDADSLRAAGVAVVYTPKDFNLNKIMADVITLADPEDGAA